ncbi:MAG: hypothetical protein FWE61_11930, partial [Micrococcales bacterium]|nr:hypothetical protein [Micrococcales bacterium]
MATPSDPAVPTEPPPLLSSETVVLEPPAPGLDPASVAPVPVDPPAPAEAMTAEPSVPSAPSVPSEPPQVWDTVDL